MNTQLEGLTAEAARFVYEEKKTHFIGGNWQVTRNARTAEVNDPCTGGILTTIPLATAAEVDFLRLPAE